MENNTKYCKFCAAKIPMDAVICSGCGRQVEEIKAQASQQPQVIVNNNNTNTNTTINRNVIGGRLKNKWVALILCICLGFFGAHKFYEEKIGMGIVYLFTVGLFGIGWILDIFSLLAKPNLYYV